MFSVGIERDSDMKWADKAPQNTETLKQKKCKYFIFLLFFEIVIPLKSLNQPFRAET